MKKPRLRSLSWCLGATAISPCVLLATKMDVPHLGSKSRFKLPNDVALKVIPLPPLKFYTQAT
ncbi:hypothetical protein SCA6_012057 [Theobroma cacao]